MVILCLRNARRYYGYVLSIFVHGAFHLAQYVHGWPLPPHIERVAYIPFALGFVGGFGVGTTAGSKSALVLIVASLELFRRYHVPDAFAFAYTNAWIYAVASYVGASAPKAPSAQV